MYTTVVVWLFSTSTCMAPAKRQQLIKYFSFMLTPRRDWCRDFQHLTKGVGNNHINPNVIQAVSSKSMASNTRLTTLVKSISPDTSSLDGLKKHQDRLLFLQCNVSLSQLPLKSYTYSHIVIQKILS